MRRLAEPTEALENLTLGDYRALTWDPPFTKKPENPDLARALFEEIRRRLERGASQPAEAEEENVSVEIGPLVCRLARWVR